MGLTAYEIYLVFLSQFNRYQEDVQENRAAKRQRYKEDLKENRAAKRQKYEDNSAAIKASERNRYWNDPAVRLAKRAAERRSIAGFTELPLPPKGIIARTSIHVCTLKTHVKYLIVFKHYN